MKIKNLQNGIKINNPLLVVGVIRGVAQNGAPYLSVSLQDNTGTIDGKLWDVSKEQEETIQIGRIINVLADVLQYRQNLQLRINQVSFNPDEVYDFSQFITASVYEIGFLKQEIQRHIEMIADPIYRQIVDACFAWTQEDFYKYPAATKNHHEFVGGLATHVYGMLLVAVELCKIYPQLNRDLLLSGILIHDMGKIEEYSAPVLSEYTIAGKLIGHISLMQAKLYELAQKAGIADTEQVLLLRHLILSHHGQYEFGSPVLPLVKEAEILNFIDNIDARMNMMEKVEGNTQEGEFSTRVFSLENRSFYKPKSSQ